ncbi:MAG: Crp/Fnr family transcriptional regulator [Ruminococcaceae bacterium]|nr:Crp/Fnr family transcriptional regulator [Oscillospiraceae bacterium]
MKEIAKKIHSTLFDGIEPENYLAVLGCTGYHLGKYRKGDIVAFEAENIRHIGIILSGTVDMIKEDFQGDKYMLLRLGRDEVFGETFACGSDSASIVTFMVSEDSEILFMPFSRMMHSCSKACAFHHRLIENMLRIIADKNRELLQKVEVVSKRTIRERLLVYLSMQPCKSEYIEIPFGRTELAEYLCVDRSALSRELVKLKAEGIIDYDRNCFRIL